MITLIGPIEKIKAKKKIAYSSVVLLKFYSLHASKIPESASIALSYHVESAE